MAERVVLHIGAPKSGTTYLQSILFASRSPLAAQGVLVPGSGVGDYSRMAKAMRTRRRGNGPAGRTWRAVRDQVAGWSGTAVLSSEWFCLTPAELVGRAVGELAPARVEVVYTARAPVEQVPAAWQETLKLGSGLSLEEFVTSLAAGDGRWSWWSLDPVRVLSRWRAEVPPEQITVVTVPRTRSEPDLLLHRFAEACGFDPAGCDTSRSTPNESLSVEAAVLAARLAPALTERIDFDAAPWTDRYRWLRRLLGHELLVPWPGTPIGVPATVEQELLERAEASSRALAEAGYRVRGDLGDLVGPTRRAGARAPQDVPVEDVLDLAVDTIAELLARLRAETLRNEGGSSGAAEPSA